MLNDLACNLKKNNHYCIGTANHYTASLNRVSLICFTNTLYSQIITFSSLFEKRQFLPAKVSQRTVQLDLHLPTTPTVVTYSQLLYMYSEGAQSLYV